MDLAEGKPILTKFVQNMSTINQLAEHLVYVTLQTANAGKFTTAANKWCRPHHTSS